MFPMKGMLPPVAGLIALLLFLPAQFAQATGPAPKPAPTPAWPLPELDYFIGHLPPPPRPGSFRDRMDLSDAIARQKVTTPEEIASVERSYLFNVFYFSSVLGPNFTPKNYPKTAAFFTKVTNTANIVVSGLKDHYKRPRPFQAHPNEIKLLVPNEPGYGYPSGHTTRSRLCASIMAQLAPQYKAKIFSSAQQVATDRILAGEHYLTDLEGGRRLAKILFSVLSEDMQFQKDLADLQAAEWSGNSAPLNKP